MRENLLPSAELTGRVLGDYVVEEQIGAGGMGAVYRARQVNLDREVVIKVLLAGQRRDVTTQQRFLREAKLASSLNHPFAAHIYDFGVAPDGLLWIAMELVQGTSLEALLAKTGPLPLARLVPLMERICEVVHAAHEQGIIHRDLKPANIMVLSYAGRYSPKLLDLGVAKIWSDADAEGAKSATLTPDPLATPQDTPLAGGEAELHADTASLELPSPAPAPPTLSERPQALGPPSLSLSAASSSTLNLTQQLTLVGTPAYVAPELWVDPRLASPRSDVYALGVILFEMMTGHRPFHAKTLPGYARAHAGPLPQLGDGYLPSLQGVLERALARRPTDRFATGLELAQALRQAAALPELDELPRLSEELRERSLTEFPEPLAELVATVDAARSRAQLKAALEQAARGFAHWLGLLALSARLQAGPGAEDDAAPVKALFAQLGARRLEPAEWLRLVEELTRPFVRLDAAYPLPELVRALHGEHRVTEKLLRLLSEDPGAAADAGAAPASLTLLGQVLDGLAFLCSYTVGVESQGALELWRGVRPRRRPARATRLELSLGMVVLVDGEGTRSLNLSPLARTYPPSPGVPPELFLFAGSGRDGARLVSLGLGFERHERELLRELAEAGLPTSSGPAAGALATRAPYMGLSSFTSQDTSLFFGREREAEACANRLREQSLMAIVGPSGAGKSSFVQAGVVPLLPEGWLTVVVRPGPRPLQALEQRLEQGGFGAQNLGQRLLGAPEALGQLLREDHRHPGIVLFVDQFEELLTLCPSEPERRAYALALTLAAGDPAVPVRVVLAMRDDFLIALKQLPGLQQRLALGLELLSTPSREDLVRILVEPARRAGLGFEDEQLPLEIAEAVERQAGALPLLSFTALKLWELRDRRLQRMTRAAYTALGGVGGALAQHAESVLGQLTEKEHLLVREAFRHLVTTLGTRAVMRRDEMEQLMGSSQLGQAVLERLVSARLLVTSEGDGGVDRIEVIHEALLSSWPRLVAWQREDAESARLREQLRAAARQWEDRGRPRGVLWRGDALVEYKLWKARFGGPLTQSEGAFVGASLAADGRARWLFRGGVSGVILALAVGLLSVLHSMREARANVLRLTVDQGRQLLLAGEPLRALAVLLHAKAAGAEGPVLELLLGRSAVRLEGEERVFSASHDPLWVAQFSPDERQVLTAGVEGVARVFDVASGALTATLRGHTGVIRRAAFSPDGLVVATAAMDKTVALWSARTGERQLVLPHPAAVPTVAFSADGTRVLSAADDGVARAFDARTGQLQAQYGEPGPALRYAWWTPDERWVVTGQNDGRVRVFEAATGRRVSTLEGHTQMVLRGAISHDGRFLLSVSADRTARVFALPGGESVSTFRQHGDTVFSLAWSPDDRHVATGAVDGTVYVWNPATGAVETSLKLAGYASSLMFAPDGRTLALASRAGTVQTWTLPEGERRWAYVGHAEGVYSATYSRDGARLLSAGVDGTARLWDASLDATRLRIAAFGGGGRKESAAMWAATLQDDRELVATSGAGGWGRWSASDGQLLQRSEEAVMKDFREFRSTMAPLSPDGRTFAMTSGHEAQLRDAQSFALRATLRHPGELSGTAWSPSGELLATSSLDGAVTLWRVGSGEKLATFQHDGPAVSVGFSPDGRWVVSASKDHSVRVWDVEHGGKAFRTFLHDKEASYAEFSHDGRTVLSSSEDKTARLWDVRSGALLAAMENAEGIYHAALSPDGSLVASGGDDGKVRLWDARTGLALDVVGEHQGISWFVAWTPHGDGLLSGDEHGTLKRWNVQRQAPAKADLELLARCRIPYEVKPDGTVVSHEVPPCAAKPFALKASSDGQVRQPEGQSRSAAERVR